MIRETVQVRANPGGHRVSAEPRSIASASFGAPRQKRLLLVSNRVMHYRVSLYNNFARRFQRVGWDFSVLTNVVEPAGRAKVRFECREVPFGAREYLRQVTELRPDVVVLFLHLKDLVVWPLMHWLKWSHTPFAFWTKGRNLDEPNSVARRLAFAYVHALSDALILYTAGCRQYVSGSHAEKVFVANNTINFDDVPPVTETKEEIRQSLGLPYEKVVLFVGRIGEEKNRKKVDHLIEMFRRLDRQDVGLVIVGSGLSPELAAQINPRNTVYLGAVHDEGDVLISRIFKMADVCSIPGHVGLGLNQAFYWGLPMVTEEGNQPPEIEYLVSGRNGFMVAEDDREALAKRIMLLVDDDATRGEFGRNARADIQKNASVEGMHAGFLQCAEYLYQKRTDAGSTRQMTQVPA